MLLVRRAPHPLLKSDVDRKRTSVRNWRSLRLTMSHTRRRSVGLRLALLGAVWSQLSAFLRPAESRPRKLCARAAAQAPSVLVAEV